MMRIQTSLVVVCLFSTLTNGCSQEGIFTQASQESKVQPERTPPAPPPTPVTVKTDDASAGGKDTGWENEEQLQDLAPIPSADPDLSNLNSLSELEDLFKSSASNNETPTSDQATPPQAPAVDSLNAWCKGATEARQMSKAGLKSLHAELCDGEKPKEIFSKTLLAAAYSGTGTLTFTPLRDLASDYDTEITSVRFAFAIKIPIDVKAYFDKVSPKAVEAEALKAVVEGPGGTGTVTVLENFTNDGPHHVRGVLANQVLRKQVRGRNVTVASDTRTDHHMISDGQAYMFTASVIRAISSIVHTDTLSALVKVDGQSYFINVVDAAVPNRGFARIAEPELARSSQAGAMALYQRIVTNSMP